MGSKVRFRRRISHEPNRMQMRENKGFCSFAFDSAHVKYGVWTWPKTAQSDAEVLTTPAPEVAENSSSQQEQSNPPLVNQLFSLFETYPASQLDEKSKQLEGKSKVVKEAAEFKFKGNRKQFKLNAQLDHIFGQIEVSLNKLQEVRNLVLGRRQLIRKQQKLIKLADKSKDGWPGTGPRTAESETLLSHSPTEAVSLIWATPHLLSPEQEDPMMGHPNIVVMTLLFTNLTR